MQRHLISIAIAAVLLAACGSEPPPEPAPAVSAEPAPAPAPAAPPAAAAVASAPPPPAPTYTHPAMTRQATAVIPADAIGGTPVPTMISAFERGHAAIRKWCDDNGIDCESFYAKDTQEIEGAWVMQFFGAPGGNGMYIDVRVYPDGRAEIVK